MVREKGYKFYALLSVVLFAIAAISFTIGNTPLIAAQLGLSTGTAIALVNLLDNITSVATALTIIAAFTGVGTIGSAVAVSVLAILKKKGKAKAAAF